MKSKTSRNWKVDMANTRTNLEEVGRAAARIVDIISTMADEEIKEYVSETEAFELRHQLAWIVEALP